MISAHRHPLHTAGMSLVELLVAMLLLSLMTVLGWRALDGVLRARDALTAQGDAMRGHQLAFAQLEADCARLVRSTAFDGQPTLSAAPGRLLLLRSVSAEGAPDQLQIVMYRNDGGQLTRSTSVASRDLDVLHGAWQAALTASASLAAVTLDAQVAALEFHTWSGGAWLAAGGGDAGAGATTGATTIAPTTAVTIAAGRGTMRGPRPRRVVRAPVTVADATGLQVTLRVADKAGALVRMFMLGAG
ncbi:type II secretory pathway component PulJ [Duganella sp. FT134W]|uniref:Type II secretory pathway component PulJ n=1 Tax=Duganella margarita TaxID=2692170 RepID=A0A7X4H004_9BURK|nr:type II secretory pathway component PulJ [Duganella margarita]MYM72821.1 type II secretory pathway component PulJ [Duganella margarita]